MDYFDGEDLARIAMTSTTGRQYAAATIYRRVFALLRHTIDSYEAFIELLECNGAVLAGLSALCILFPQYGRPPSNPINILCPRATHDNVVRYLSDREQFSSQVIEPDPAQTGKLRYPAGVRKVVKLSKGHTAIHVVQSTHCSALLPITSEWGSALFNYISPTSYMSAYAPMTRAGWTLVNPARLADNGLVPSNLRRQLRFWQRSGWMLTLKWKLWCNGAANCIGVNSMGCAAATRFFGDKYCITGSAVLGGHGHADPENTSEGVTVIWWRGGRTCREECSRGCRDVVPGARVIPTGIAHKRCE